MIDIQHYYREDKPFVGFDIQGDPFCFYQEISNAGSNFIKAFKIDSGGLFHAGVIQYAMSFYNKNAQETPVVFQTPLHYISHNDRGEAPDKRLGCAFNVHVYVSEEDRDRFDYVRVYSIYRSSIDTAPLVKVVKDIKCKDMTYMSVQYP